LILRRLNRRGWRRHQHRDEAMDRGNAFRGPGYINSTPAAKQSLAKQTSLDVRPGSGTAVSS
jgi:hypothetical protein